MYIFAIATGLIGGFSISLAYFTWRKTSMSNPYIPQSDDITNICQELQELFDEIPGETYQDKLNHLSNCHCCDRHQVNKPTVFRPWYETPYNNTQHNYPCMCNCRHLARFICRQANNLPILTRTNTPNNVIDF